MLIVVMLAGNWACNAPEQQATPEQSTIIAEFSGGTITEQDFNRHILFIDKKTLRTRENLAQDEGVEELLREYAVLRILASGVEDETTNDNTFLYLNGEARDLVKYYQDRTGKRVHEISDDELSAWYEEHLDDRFTVPESIRFQHIYLRHDRHDDAQLKALTNEIMGELGRGVEFKDMVARYSESGSVSRDGVVGPVFRGRIDQDFERQVFALSEGGRPETIRTALGTHVVQVLAKKAPRVLPFDEVKGQIATGLMNRKDAEELKTHFEVLRERYGVVDHSAEPGTNEDDVVLTIKDRSMTRAELDECFEQMAGFGQAYHAADPETRARMASELIEFNLMYLDALESGLDREQNFLDRQALRDLHRKADIGMQRRLTAWSESVSEAELQAYFENHRARFAFPMSFETSYVFVPFGQQPPFETQVQAEGLAQLAQKHGFDSAELQAACSENGARCIQPGPMSPMQAARIAPSFQRTLLAMGNNEVSDPVKTESGIFVIFVGEVKARRPMTFPDDMDAIRARFLSLENDRVVTESKDQLLIENDFVILSLPTLEIPNFDG